MSRSILIVQEAGRHPENAYLREGLSLQRAFDYLGVKSDIYGAGYPNYSKKFSEVVKDFDTVLIVENYAFQSLPLDEIKKCKAKKLFWTIDSHVALSSHQWFADQIGADIVMSSTDRYCNHYKGISKKQYHLPNCYDDFFIFPHPNVPRIHNVGFCGNINNRQEILNKLQLKYNLSVDVMKLGLDMVRTICSYKIHFNKCIGDDVNYRIFETLGAGVFCLTNHNVELGDLFDFESHLNVYYNENDLYDKIQKFIDKPELREQIASRGYQWVKNNHTYRNRCKQILTYL